MKLHKVSAKNLFSVQSVSLDLNDRGLLLVDGFSHDDGCSNGAGKSTVANKIILWTLFGKTAGGIRADKVVNCNKPDDLAYGTVVFSGKGEKAYNQYTVKRTRNPSSLKLIKAGNDISARHEKDTQELINQALGRDFKTFLHTDFFGQGRKDSFLELTPKEQAELLEDLLPIEQVDSWAAKAKDFKDRWSKLLLEAEKIIGRLEGHISEGKRSLQTASNNYDSWRLSQIARRSRIEQQIKKAPSIDDLVAKRDVLVSATAKAQQMSEEYANNDLQKNRKMREEWLTVLARAKSKTTQIDDQCATCNQPLPPEMRDKLMADREEALSLVASANNSLAVCDDWIAYCEAVLDGYKAKRELADIEAKIAGTETAQLKEQLEELDRQVNPYEEMLRESESRLESLAESLERSRLDEAMAKRRFNRYEFWVKAFSKDFKALLFQKACPFLEDRTQRHLAGLGNQQLKVTFSTAKLLQSGETRDEFNISVKSENGGSSYDTLSGGEQQIASFAVGLALADLAAAQVGGPSEFLILDEPFVSLSDRNCENIVRYLQDTIRKVKSTILLISNEPSLKMLIPDKITVIKENGVTSIGELS